MKLRAFGAVVLFAAGLALGLLGYAAIDPSRFSIDAGTQDTLVVAIGAIVTALLAVVATCVANEVDPLAYLTDVLTRLDSTPADQVDTLLPQNWAVLAP